MRVIILATDEQLGLPPLTDTTPAPLLPVANRPVMATTVEILARAGYKHLLVSLCNRSGQIAAYFGTGKRWGVQFEYLTQREELGSAGALKWAARLLDETFLVLPADCVIDLDVEAALAFHQAHGGPATAIVHRSPGGRAADPVRLDDGGRLVAVGAADAAGSGLRLAGAYIFEPQVLQHIPARTVYDSAAQLIPALLAAGEAVHGYEMTGYWNPLDTPGAFQEAQQVFLYSAYAAVSPEQELPHGPAARVRFPSLEGRQVVPGIWVGLNHNIHPTVRLAAPVLIGANSWIGREVELDAGAIIGANVVIDDEATVRGSTVLADTYVGHLVNVESRIVNATTIIDPATGEHTRVVDPFLLAPMSATRTGPSRLLRMLTVLATLLLLALALPLLPLLGLLALLGSGRLLTRTPVVGERLGSGELRRFALLSLATRRPDGSSTPLGRWLEAWELQRIPELINVLRGEMALVGVRPLRPEDAEQLVEEWHQKRHDSPAGFTGLWYTQAAEASDLDTVLVADVYYTATRTWRGDLRLLLRTPAVWLRRHMQRGARIANNQEYFGQADNLGSM